MRAIIQILINALAIFLAVRLVPGIQLTGEDDLLSFILIGLVLGLINFFIKPFLKLISAPLIILSLGLFTIFINMAMLWLLEYLIDDLEIIGFGAYFWGTIVISTVNIFLGSTLKKDLSK